MDREKAKRQAIADGLSRRYLLEVINAARGDSATGSISAQAVIQLVHHMYRPSSERHAICLLRDLANAELIEEWANAVGENDTWGIAQIECKVTAKGTALLAEAISPEPLVSDRRA